MLRVKLPHLNKWSEKRRKNAEYYNQLFIKAGLAEDTGKIKFDEKNRVLLPKAIYKTLSQSSKKEIRNYHIYNQYIIRVQQRDELKKFLTENEIGNEIYYPVPFHLQECFADLNYKKGEFPISEEACNTSLALPVFPELTKEQQEFVVLKIKEFIQA